MMASISARVSNSLRISIVPAHASMAPSFAASSLLIFQRERYGLAFGVHAGGGMSHVKTSTCFMRPAYRCG